MEERRHLIAYISTEGKPAKVSDNSLKWVANST
jgi:hypothetical protein